MRRAILVFILVAVASLSACDRAPRGPMTDAEMGLEFPFQGVWEFPPIFEESVFLLVSYEDGTGVLRIEKGGRIAHTYFFDVTAPRAIRLRDAHGQPVTAEKFSLAKIQAIVALDNPPPEIRLEVAEPDPEDPEQTRRKLTLYGLLSEDSEVCSYLGVASDQLVNLPFASIEADLDLTIPDGTEARFAENSGVWGMIEMRFPEPVHPGGEVRSLAIDELDVALVETTLVEGMLKTRDFGELEVLMLGPSNIAMRATRSQIEAIRAELERRDVSRAGDEPTGEG